MFFDLNINEFYNKDEIEFINQSEYTGICLNRKLSARDYIVKDPFNIPDIITKDVYTRIEIDVRKEDLSFFNIKRVPNYDIISIKASDEAVLRKACTEWYPDLITFDNGLKLKDGYIRDAMFKNVFFEITVSDALYNSKDRINWMRCVRNILKITKGRNVIISSGAVCGTEIKRPWELVKLLNCFGLSDDRGMNMIKDNPVRLLENCALKRYAYRGVVANNLDEGILKRNFILNKYLNK
ncbi:Ribonuclease P protein subunit drpp30 [Astathelohania contejeani]|uniref:Ribonuclease P protein subunit drpp30 n=1 Tax=Astathelohania contejeani TaxID=164912 RepID=A0ABQ7HY13_9MICR|nr:Ribonuclease P protein subunit drpp30 [Thelohania contejeani]